MSDLLIQLTDARAAQRGREVLRDLTLELPRGAFAYLIGRTGAGKSTLLKTLYAALPLAGGRGSVVGYDLRRLNRSSIPTFRRKLGVVYQDFNLLEERTVTENLRFVLEATDWTDSRAIRARIGEVLAEVGLADRGDSYPGQLSGGEQQRVVLARALLNRPSLLIADEPTGNLDPETADDVMVLIRRLAADSQMGVLFATHDYRIIERFPGQIFRCRGGTVVSDQELALD